jgi:hypothetical protein
VTSLQDRNHNTDPFAGADDLPEENHSLVLDGTVYRLYRTATFRGWTFHAFVNDLDVVIEPEMPEHPRIIYETTGLQGGDAGHGGKTTLKFVFDDDTYGYDGDLYMEEFSDRVEVVKITAKGDWEMDGILYGLIFLGSVLDSRAP